MRIADFSFYVIRAGEEAQLGERHAIDRQVYLEAGIEATFFHFVDRGVTGYQPGGAKVYRSSGNFFWLPLKMLRDLRAGNYDAVIVHSFSFPIQVIALKWFLRRRTTVIVRHHAEQPFKNWIKRFLQKAAYRQADAFTFVSRTQAAPFIRDNIICAPHFINEVMEGSTTFTPGDKTAARKKLHIGDETVFLWVGRLDSNKDPLTVLQAFSRLCTDWRLYMVFSADNLLTEVRDFIEQKGMQERVVLAGKVDYREMESWYRASDYFVVASHYEGSGYALCEAMACGCVPLVSRIPSFIKMTAGGTAGYLFNAGDSGDLYALLESLHPAQYGEMRAGVLRHFEMELSQAAIGRKLAAIIRGFSSR